MTRERLAQLTKQCRADLAEAERQRHTDWINTLRKRLASLERMARNGRSDVPEFGYAA